MMYSWLPYTLQPDPRLESYWLDEWGNPVWAHEYPVGYHEERYFGGAQAPEDYVGLDSPSLSSYGQQLGQEMGRWGTQAAQALKQKLGSGLGTGISQSLGSLSPLGDAPQRASKAADAAAAAADEISALSRRANASLDRADRTMKEHEETVRIVKFAVIGIGVLGGMALIFSMVKK